MEATQSVLWDPFHEAVTPTTYADKDAVVLQKIHYYQNHPNRIKTIKRLLYIFPVLGILCILFLASHNFLEGRLYFFILILSLMPPGSYNVTIRQLQTQAITLLVSEKYNWIYDPADDTESMEKLAAFFPAIFQISDDQHLVDQMWGSISMENKIYQFWQARFLYTVGSGRSRHTENQTIFALPLPSSLPISFSLQHEELILPFERRIKTESEEFNKTFMIVADRIDETNKQGIYSVLTPSLQVRLIAFAKQYKPDAIMFNQNMLFFTFSLPFWSPKFTNFANQIGVDPRDEAALIKSLTDLVTLPTEMLQFITT